MRKGSVWGFRRTGQLARLDRLEDRHRQQLADALLAEVVEMQAVVGDELRVRHAIIVPGPHDLEASEQAGVRINTA